MTLPLVTAAVALFYLGAIPIRIAFCLRIGTDAHFGFGIAPFETRFARARAREVRKKPSTPSKLPPKEFLRSARYLLTHLDALRLEGTFGSGDAALTALICGAADALGRALGAATRRVVRIALRPDFAADRLCADVFGIVSLRTGHIMLAALLGVYEYATGRFQQWTSTPSKAS